VVSGRLLHLIAIPCFLSFACAGSHEVAPEDISHFRGTIAQNFYGRLVEVSTANGTVRGTLVSVRDTADVMVVGLPKSNIFAADVDSVVPMSEVSGLRFVDYRDRRTVALVIGAAAIVSAVAAYLGSGFQD
jgi:hypothetical protein